MKHLFFATFLALMISGCGLGSTPNDDSTTQSDPEIPQTNEPKITATVIDSIVEGISYKCNSDSGVSDENGVISFAQSCEKLSFNIGGIFLGDMDTKDIKSDRYIYPADIYGVDRNDTADQNVIKYIQLLQTLDSDQNPYNGISIDSDIASALENSDISLESASESDIDSLLFSKTGEHLIKKEYAIAHYEETLREMLNLNIDTVPPAPAFFTQEPTPTNKDSATVEIAGEIGAKVFIDGQDSGVTIGDDHKATVVINTQGDEGSKTAKITLQDGSGKSSDPFNASVIKDLTPPAMVSLLNPPTFINSDKTELTFTGEDGTVVMVNGQEVGIIKDGNLTAEVNTSGEDGELTLIITVKDLAGNINQTQNTISLTKDTTPPQKPQLITNLTPTNQDSTSVEISGEPGSKVYIDDQLVETIPEDGNITISLDTSAKENGILSFLITVEDLAGNKSEPLTLEIQKDSTPPEKPEVTYLPEIENDTVTSVIQGEKDAKVYINDTLVGSIDDSGTYTALLQDPKSSYYELFNIYLEDLAGNKGPVYTLRITFHREAFDDGSTYYVPQDATVLRKSAPGEEAIIFSFDEQQTLGGAIVKVDFENQTLADKLNAIISSISSLQDISNISKITEQDNQNSILAEFTISSSSDSGTIDLVSEISNSIKGGTLSNLPSSDANSIKSNYFNLRLNLVKDENGKSYVTFSLVPNDQSLNYQTYISSITNSTNLVENGISLPNIDEEYDPSQESVARTADFVFVIDDSGSMAAYQNAVAQAANDFANAIQNAGVNFRIAIITTGDYINDPQGTSSYYASRVLNSVGFIENDIDLFKEKVIVGTDGSSTETGIYNAESALKSIAKGDEYDGILTKMGMPKDDQTPLSVIILSDEESQYSSRAGSSFDVNNNLFVNRGYTVYSIINTSVNSYSQYDDLAQVTNGMIADISYTNSYDIIMNTIAEKSSSKLGYKLQHENVIESTIYITKNGVEVPHSNTNGWRYNETYNSILFSGSSIPTESDEVKITYSYIK